MRPRPAPSPLTGFYHFYPGVPAVVGVRARDRVNFCPAVWNTGLSVDPPLFAVALSPKRFTHGLLLEAGRFSASFHPLDQAGLIQELGSLSGREVDKARYPHFLGETGVPILGGAYAAFELELLDHRPYGDHDLFVGRVVVLWEGEGLEGGRPRPGLPLLYWGGGLYSATPPALFRPGEGG